MKMTKKVVFEKGVENNFDEFVLLITKLAKYEKLTPPDNQGKVRLKKDCLSKNPKFEAYLAKIDDKFVGYVIFLMTYSSYLALPTLYIEDIFVLEKYRRKGIGQKLFDFCIKQTKKRGCGRMEWCAFNWNTTAMKFYEKNKATKLNKTYYRMTQEQMNDRELKNGLS